MGPIVDQMADRIMSVIPKDALIPIYLEMIIDDENRISDICHDIEESEIIERLRSVIRDRIYDFLWIGVSKGCKVLNLVDEQFEDGFLVMMTEDIFAS